MKSSVEVRCVHLVVDSHVLTIANALVILTIPITELRQTKMVHGWPRYCS